MMKLNHAAYRLDAEHFETIVDMLKAGLVLSSSGERTGRFGFASPARTLTSNSAGAKSRIGTRTSCDHRCPS